MLLCSVITWLTGPELDRYSAIAVSVNAGTLGAQIMIREQDLWFAYLIDPELVRDPAGDQYV